MEKHIVHYNHKLKARARELRNNATRGEIILWQHLKNSQMMGYDFDRQKPIDQFIVDFYCKSLALVIEIDGSAHDSQDAQAYDKERQAHLEGLGNHVLRFSDNEVRSHSNKVCQTIADWIFKHRQKAAQSSDRSQPTHS
ncbi:MAG: endonuclease domain-containing protein [Phormidesmis sp.]